MGSDRLPWERDDPTHGRRLEANREDRARIILDRMCQFVALLTPDGAVCEVNQAALEGAGLDRDEVIGQPFWQTRWWQVDTETACWLQSAIRRAATGETVHREVSNFGALGGKEVIDVDFVLSPVPGAAGRVEFLLAEGRDVTARKRAERELARQSDALRCLIDSRHREESHGDPIARGEAIDLAVRMIVEPILREGRRRLHELAERLPQLVWMSDPDGRSDDQNRRFREYTGLCPVEGVVPCWLDLVHADDRDEARGRWWLAVSAGEPCEFEGRLRRADGAIRWHLIRGVPLHDERGQIVSWFCTASDIEERKSAEIAVRASESRLRAVFENAMDAMVIADDEGRYVDANPAACELFGLGRAQLLERSIVDFAEPGADVKAMWAAFRRAGHARGTFRLVRPDGSIRETDFAATAEIQPGRHLSVLRDVTERRHYEERLSEWNNRYDAAVQATQQVLYDWDTTSDQVIFSGTCEQVLGYRPEELSGGLDRWIDRIHPDDRAAFDEEIKRVRSTLEPFHLEYRVRHKEGAEIIVQDDGRFIPDGTEGPTRVVGFLVDVTGRWQAEMALRESERQYRMMANNATDIISRHDPGGAIRFVSPACGLLLGFEPEELLGQSLEALVHPDDRFLVARLHESVLTNDEVHLVRVRLRHKDGRYLWTETTCRSLRDPVSASVREIQCATRDITDRVEAEHAIEQAERFARSVLDSLSAHIAVLDETGTILAVNQAWRSFAQANGGDATQMTEGANYLQICDSAQGDDVAFAAEFAAGIRDVIAGRRPQCVMEYPCHSPDQDRWFLGRVTPFRGPGPRNAVVAHEEITPLRLVEQRLEQQRERLASIVDNVMDAIISIDDRGTIMTANASAERIFGHTAEEMVGRNVAMLMPEPHRSWHDQYIENYLGTGIPRIIGIGREVEGLRRDGSTFPLDLAVAEFQQHGRHYFTGVLRDITDRKRIEETQRRYAERLTILRRIDQAILSADSSESIARVVLRTLPALVSYTHARVERYDYQIGTAVVLASAGKPIAEVSEGSRIPITNANPSSIRSFMQGKVYHKDDLSTEDTKSPLHQVLVAAGLRSYVKMPLAYQGRLIGSLTVGSDQVGAFGPEQVEIVQEVADSLAVAMRHSQLFEEVCEGRDRLERLSRRLLKAEENERRRIARELHDEIGQALTAIRIHLQTSQTIAREPRTLQNLDEGIELIDQAIRHVRGLSLTLRPSILDDLGLVPALRSLITGLARRSGIEATFTSTEEVGRLNPEVETTCYRITQEALTNVLRHAHAQSVRVELERRESDVRVTVTDDGRGFDIASCLARASSGSSLGLLGMRERAALLGGRVEMESTPERGSVIRATIPIEAPRSNAGDPISKRENM